MNAGVFIFSGFAKTTLLLLRTKPITDPQQAHTQNGEQESS